MNWIQITTNIGKIQSYKLKITQEIREILGLDHSLLVSKWLHQLGMVSRIQCIDAAWVNGEKLDRPISAFNSLLNLSFLKANGYKS